MPGPLAGIIVIDFTEYIAGPYCTMMLADMGADVIKVEKPEGDAWRHTAPVAPYEARIFLGVNRGKRSIALDLTRSEGQAAARRMLATADVAVLNYRPGVAERLGIDYRDRCGREPARSSTARTPPSGARARTPTAPASTSSRRPRPA